MYNNDFNELKQACTSAPEHSEEQIVGAGESVWFMGKAAAAPKGMIALAQSEEMHLLLREEDILEVEKKKDYFLVKVRGEGNVLARYQQVMKAGARGCTCDIDDETQASLRIASQWNPWGDPIGPPFLRCRFYWNCVYMDGRKVCFWWIFCPSRVGRV